MKKIKIQKPIDTDVSLKYNCPTCNLEHWLFLREAQTKNYRVVCDCGTVFKPKRVNRIKILYASLDKPKEIVEEKSDIPVDVLDQSVKILCDHGFSKRESVDLVKRAFSVEHSLSVISLVKTAIKLFGETHEK